MKMAKGKEIMNFNDIVFEKRNKEYGAYVLRKKYNSILIKSTIITILIVSSIIIIPYIRNIKKPYTIGESSGRKFVYINMENMQPPPEEIYVPPVTPPPPAPEATQNIVKYVAPVIIDTVKENEFTLPPIEEVKLMEETTSETFSASFGTGDDELFGEGSGSGGNKAYDYFILEVPPKFMGGDIEKFREWLRKRVVYPKEAQEKGISGKVYLTFIVEPDGTVSNVKVVKGVDKILDEVAKKAIEESPPWTPGFQRGKPVRVRFSIFLNFEL